MTDDLLDPENDPATEPDLGVDVDEDELREDDRPEADEGVVPPPIFPGLNPD